DRPGGRGVLSIVQQPPPGGKLRRVRAQSVPQWGDGARAGNQQGRQRQGAQNHDRARLAVAALPARQRLEHLVRERVGILKGRIRRITIVALARKLLVALWRYLETGLIPQGALLKA